MNVTHARIFTFLLGISLFFGCGLDGAFPPDKAVVRQTLQNIRKSDLEKDANKYFTHFVKALHAPFENEKSCGLFKTDMKQDEQQFSENGEGNGTYTRTVGEDKKSIIYSYNGYKPKGTQFTVNGKLEGTNWNPQEGSITVNGLIIIVSPISKDKEKDSPSATFDFNDFEISHCRQVESGTVNYTYPLGIGLPIHLKDSDNQNLLKALIQGTS